MHTKKFTTEEGLEIQAKQLEEWKSVLVPEVYNALHEYATRNNNIAKSGWDVCRGTGLNNYIANYMLGHRY